MKYEIKEIDYQPVDLLYSCKLKPVFMPHGGSHGVILGAFKENKEVGCIIYTFVDKDPFLSRYPENGVYIERICTEKKHRRKGIGKNLLEICIRDTRIQSSENNMMYGDPIDWDAIDFYKKSKIGIKENTRFRNFLKEQDMKTEEWRKQAISDIKSGKSRTLDVVDKNGKVVGKSPLSLSYLESFDQGPKEGLENILGKRNGFNLIWHDISEINPEYFLKEGDLQQRKEYWKNRI